MSYRQDIENIIFIENYVLNKILKCESQIGQSADTTHTYISNVNMANHQAINILQKS